MTLYYNIFGPEIYYKLFSLGALGEGDKDTFAAAALACGEKYYQVASSIRTLGYFDTTPGGGFHGIAMAQKILNWIISYFRKLIKISKICIWIGIMKLKINSVPTIKSLFSLCIVILKD